MPWSEVKERISKYIPTGRRPFGIPRGGMIVAAMCPGTLPASSPREADMLVDDIRDSGETARQWGNKYKVPIYFLVDKLTYPEDAKLGWVVFPWEEWTGEETGPTDAVRRLLKFIGENPRRDGLLRTPERVVKSLKEMTDGYEKNPEELLKVVFELDTDEMIIARGLRFSSLCEHHILPFTGTATIAYVPKGKRVVGISKLARVLDVFAHRLQIQERLTTQIAKCIGKVLHPAGVGVILRAQHQCMGCRGVRQPDGEMVTSCMLGCMRKKPEARAELMALSK